MYFREEIHDIMQLFNMIFEHLDDQHEDIF